MRRAGLLARAAKRPASAVISSPVGKHRVYDDEADPWRVPETDLAKPSVQSAAERSTGGKTRTGPLIVALPAMQPPCMLTLGTSRGLGSKSTSAPA